MDDNTLNALNPEYSDVPRVITVLENVAKSLK